MGGSRAGAGVTLIVALTACKKDDTIAVRPRAIVAVDEHHALVLGGLGDSQGGAWLVDDTGKTVWARTLPGGPQGQEPQVGVTSAVVAVAVTTDDQLVELVGLARRDGAQQFRTPVDLIDDWHAPIGVVADEDGFVTFSHTAVASLWSRGNAGIRLPAGRRSRRHGAAIVTEDEHRASIRSVTRSLLDADLKTLGPGCIVGDQYLYLTSDGGRIHAGRAGLATEADQSPDWDWEPIELPFPPLEGWALPQDLDSLEVEDCGTRDGQAIFLVTRYFDALLVAVDASLRVTWTLALPSAALKGPDRRHEEGFRFDGPLPRMLVFLVQPYDGSREWYENPCELVLADLETRAAPRRFVISKAACQWDLFQAGRWYAVYDGRTTGFAAIDGDTGRIAGTITLPGTWELAANQIADDTLWLLDDDTRPIAFAAVDLRTMTALVDRDALVGDADDAFASGLALSGL